MGSFHCSSPGCTRGTSRETQAVQRPQDPTPASGSGTRPPKGSKGFSTVIYDYEYVHYVLALVKYQGVEKYNGLKVVLYSKGVWEALDKTSIDPHFYPDHEGPVARFEPTDEGVLTGFCAMRQDITRPPECETMLRLLKYNQRGAKK